MVLQISYNDAYLSVRKMMFPFYFDLVGTPHTFQKSYFFLCKEMNLKIFRHVEGSKNTQKLLF